MINDLLKTYPRQRPPLPEAHQAIYDQSYKANREGEGAAEGLAKKLESWMHRKVVDDGQGPVLELGAGTLNHVPHEGNDFDYDAVEPFQSLWQGSPRLVRIRRLCSSVADLPAENRYHRIISVAVLEHMTDLPFELAQAALRLAPGGKLLAGIPSEGGFLWWLGWRCTTGLSYWLRHKLDYGRLMRHEHVNLAREIEMVVRHLFGSVSRKRFPSPFHHLSLYVFLEARDPDLDRCREILQDRRDTIRR